MFSPESFLLVFSLGTLVAAIAVAIEVEIGMRSIFYLRDIPPLASPAPPTVSIVVAARNEERHIEEALRSLLAQDYPGLEIIAVDDRSTDRTGAILENAARGNPRLKVEHITRLPAGWLGKNHALHHGALKARGDCILFTDADVVMEPTALRRAMQHLERHHLDHIAVSPVAAVPGILLNMMVAGFILCLGLFARPWRVRHPQSRFHMGVGAFNLVRASTYRSFGGHASIALRPDDDLKLGWLVKKHGFRQDFLLGREMIRVEWYHSLGEMFRGLEKNLFAGFDYSLPRVGIASVGQLALFVLPFGAIFFLPGWPRIFFAAAALLMVLSLALHLPCHGMRPRYALGLPIAMLLIQAAVWNATIKTLVQGGIRWRGTFYPLRDLRTAKPPKIRH